MKKLLFALIVVTILMINNAKVTQTDIMASNGVIHIIDTVIVPSA